MTSAGYSPDELAAWLNDAWRQLRVTREGYRQGDVDDWVTGLLTKVCGERLDPYAIRMAQFRPALREAYNVRDVNALREQLEQHVMRSSLVSTEALFTPGNVAPEVLNLAQQIKDVRFRVTRRAGYDESDVDEFLITLERALRRGEVLNGSGIRDHQFRVVSRLRPGYQQKEVREFLDKIAQGIGP